MISGITAAQPWSLQQCIDYALEHNINVQQKALLQESEEYNLRIAKYSMLPNLNAGVGQSFDFGRSANNREGIIIDQSSTSTSFSVGSNMPLFSGMRIYHQIQAGKSNLRAAMADLSKAKDDLELTITSAFLSILFNKELLHIAHTQATLTGEQVVRAEKMVEAGKSPQSELYDAKALLAQDELSVVQCENTLKLSLLDLAQLLELPNVAGFDIVDPPVDEATLLSFTTLLSADTTFHRAVLFRPEVKAAQYRLEGSKHDLRTMQSYFYPSLSLQAGYSNGYYHLNGKEFSQIPQDPFWEQLNLNHREYVGLNLNIPIFNRFETSNRVKMARLNIDQQTLQLENAKKALLKEIQQAYYNAVAAQQKFEASKKSIAASEEAFRYADERYAAGRGTNLEFNDAKTRLIKAQSDLLQAKYDYLFRCRILDFYNGVK
jgi:outer membrane protein